MMTGEKSCAVVEGDGPMRFYPLLSLSLPLVPVLSLSLFLPHPHTEPHHHTALSPRRSPTPPAS